MTQEVDVQLQVWKDLAISKQVLMGAAADALGLDSECSTAELKDALNKAIQRAKDADLVIIETRTQAEQQVFEAQERMEIAEKARLEAQAQVEIAVAARESAEHQLSVGKNDNAGGEKSESRCCRQAKQAKGYFQGARRYSGKCGQKAEDIEEAENGRSQGKNSG